MVMIRSMRVCEVGGMLSVDGCFLGCCCCLSPCVWEEVSLSAASSIVVTRSKISRISYHGSVRVEDGPFAQTYFLGSDA